MDAFHNIYKGKKVLVTGHTGFKGSWLSIWLNELGAKVIGYSLEPNTNRDNFLLSNIGSRIVDIRGDIRNYDMLLKVFQVHQPEFVFHLAAQPLVLLSYENPVDTYSTNVMGTINVLECIKNCPAAKIGIMITTDKCYDNKEQIWGYKESDALGGYDPYSSSKACAEIAIGSWRNSFMNPKKYAIHGKSIASARAGNVIGGGDWAKDRIIPDAINSLENNEPIKIRNPPAIRPWQHVLEPLYGYLLLGEKMLQDPIGFSEPWNFGPEMSSIINVWDLCQKVVDVYGNGKLEDISSKDAVHEANLLMLEISKSVFRLKWKPKLDINETVKMTVDWYKNYRNSNVYEICKSQISEYMTK